VRGETRTAIASAGGIEALVALLIRQPDLPNLEGDTLCKTNAAGALLNLAQEDALREAIGAAGGIIWAASGRIFDPQPLTQLDWGLGLSLVSSALNGLLAWVMHRAATAHRSIALEADARHLVTDVWTSAGVVVGLGLAWATGWLWLDAVVAIGVALNILREGFSLIKRSSQGLMDEALEPQVLTEIHKVLAGFEHHTIRFDHVTTRQAGQRRFVDLHMHMPAGWTLGRAAALRTSVEQALMSAVPGLRATIQLLPSDVEAHFDDPRDLI
jgi:cation diffusion facilitator family transporter